MEQLLRVPSVHRGALLAGRTPALGPPPDAFLCSPKSSLVCKKLTETMQYIQRYLGDAFW